MTLPDPATKRSDEVALDHLAWLTHEETEQERWQRWEREHGPTCATLMEYAWHAGEWLLRRDWAQIMLLFVWPFIAWVMVAVLLLPLGLVESVR